jgi:hypothetical protein
MSNNVVSQNVENLYDMRYRHERTVSFGDFYLFIGSLQ